MFHLRRTQMYLIFSIVFLNTAPSREVENRFLSNRCQLIQQLHLGQRLCAIFMCLLLLLLLLTNRIRELYNSNISNKTELESSLIIISVRSKSWIRELHRVWVTADLTNPHSLNPLFGPGYTRGDVTMTG